MQEAGNPQVLQLSRYLLFFKKINNLSPVQLVMLKTFYQQPKLDQGLPNYIRVPHHISFLPGKFCPHREAAAREVWLWVLPLRGWTLGWCGKKLLSFPAKTAGKCHQGSLSCRSSSELGDAQRSLGKAGLNLDLSSAGKGEWDLSCHWIGCSKSHPHLCESSLDQQQKSKALTFSTWKLTRIQHLHRMIYLYQKELV